MSEQDQKLFRFAGFELDLDKSLLRNASGEINLRPKTFELLTHLVRHAGRVMMKDELLGTVWTGVIVTEDSLTQTIHDIRRVLADKEQKLVRTIPRKGYLFSLDAIELDGIELERDTFRDSLLPTSREKPSIAVLPFTNMSNDPEQEFFADGLTEDLITELSKGPGLFVIARHSSFVFKNKPTDVRHIAQDLGVRYLLEGSARRAAGRIRINAQLIDALDGGHMWAERYDRQLADVFAVQDEVVAHIVEALAGKFAVAAMPERKVPKNLDAYDLVVRGRFLHHTMSLSEGIEARELFARAVALDPDYAEARAYLALTHWLGWTNWFEPIDPHRRLAVEHAKQAVSLDPNDPWAHTVLGHVLNYEHEYDAASEQFEVALRLDPNHADTHGLRADLLALHGRPIEALASVAEAMKLNPHAPAFYYWLKGQAEYVARRYKDAIDTLKHKSTYASASRSILAAALAQIGRLDEAQLEGRLFMADYPDFTINEFLSGQAFRHEHDREHFAEGYRKAGLP